MGTLFEFENQKKLFGKKPATQMATINEVLNQSLNIVQSLEVTKIVGIFDQALCKGC